MHKCPHCGEKTITTSKKFAPGWNPKCIKCNGKWGASNWTVIILMLLMTEGNFEVFSWLADLDLDIDWGYLMFLSVVINIIICVSVIYFMPLRKRKFFIF